MQIVSAASEIVRPKSPSTVGARDDRAPPGESPADRAPNWRHVLKSAIRDAATLCRRLELPPNFVAPAERAAAAFPLFVPEPYLARIRPGDPADPLLRQVLPLDAELADAPGYTADPVADSAARVSEGVLQKYAGRALLITTGACAIHCRYCFRRHYPYSESPSGLDAWIPALNALAADPSLDEVILSGGDPLTLSDGFLAELIRRIAAIGHIRRIRVHTRLPIVIPQRVTAELIAALRGTRLAPIVVVHANHPREIDTLVARAFAQLVDAGIPLLNQAVLLRGVNDDADTLAALSQTLVNHRAMPYYLHQLDPVQGAAHFAVPAEVGLSLIEDLRVRLPGYAVPRYVREVPGQPSKMPIELSAPSNAIL
ncbi:MAG: EF-P beta-lysylation protein EpmB [Planctomycetota bacterium]|nr:MAG: EF-P beta-lysylation protein EpmB [Planctomycetota bacterium]